MQKTAPHGTELCRNTQNQNAHKYTPQNLPATLVSHMHYKPSSSPCRVTISHQISDSFLPPLHSEAAALLSSASKLHILFKGKEHTLTRACIHFLTISYVQNCATPFNSFLVFVTLIKFLSCSLTPFSP